MVEISRLYLDQGLRYRRFQCIAIATNDEYIFLPVPISNLKPVTESWALGSRKYKNLFLIHYWEARVHPLKRN